MFLHVWSRQNRTNQQLSVSNAFLMVGQLIRFVYSKRIMFFFSIARNQKYTSDVCWQNEDFVEISTILFLLYFYNLVFSTFCFNVWTFCHSSSNSLQYTPPRIMDRFIQNFGKLVFFGYFTKFLYFKKKFLKYCINIALRF